MYCMFVCINAQPNVVPYVPGSTFVQPVVEIRQEHPPIGAQSSVVPYVPGSTFVQPVSGVQQEHAPIDAQPNIVPYMPGSTSVPPVDVDKIQQERPPAYEVHDPSSKSQASGYPTGYGEGYQAQGVDSGYQQGQT